MARRRYYTPFAVVAVAVSAVAGMSCGGESTSPTAPTPPTAPAPSTFTLTGQVVNQVGIPLEGVTIVVLDGPYQGRSTGTRSDGRYVLPDLTGNLNVSARKSGYNEARAGAKPQAKVLNFTLTQRGPRTNFGPGQYLVGTDIAPGRYYSDPVSGCHFQRQSGLGGTPSEAIANEYIGFDAGQWIVDILPSDVAFDTDDECGIWVDTPRRGLEPIISPGMWLVGAQILPGTYRVTMSAGCHWARLRDFTHTLDGIIANSYGGNAGPQLVSIDAGDSGFRTGDDCGAWTAAGGAVGVSLARSRD